MSVVKFTIDRKEIKNDPDLKDFFGLDKLPLAPSHVTVELKGISTAEVNALRRVLCCEMQGHHLFCSGIESTDKQMIAGYINNLIESVRIKHQLDKKAVELSLNITNNTTEMMKVYTGDFEAKNPIEPIFNPTICIAVLSPGRSLSIKKITVESGYGYVDGKFNVASNTCFTHLDIPQHPDKEIRFVGGSAVDESGYTISSMLSKPRHHLLKFVLPSTGSNPKEVHITFNDACKEIIRRLKAFASVIKTDTTRVDLDVDYFEAIVIADETYTIGEIIRSKVFEIEPNIAHISYTVNNKLLTMTFRHTSDPVPLLLKAVSMSITLFENIKE